MIDKKVLEEKLKLLTEYISDLEEQKNISLEKLKENKIHRRYIERTLHLAVEACLDIGNHIIAELRLREPEDYKDIMTVLCEAGYLPPERLDNFKKMAQFRNVIVHDYARVDPEILYQILQKNIDDLRLFARTIRDTFL
ncbi:MAG TPA: DUF86 domain-containing protein [Peptococcaceae bacterium]|nr:DUF86 domain-containing protein [Peptococcaceae bacterium]